jgi:hypothetical protein
MIASLMVYESQQRLVNRAGQVKPKNPGWGILQAREGGLEFAKSGQLGQLRACRLPHYAKSKLRAGTYMPIE